MLLAYLIITVAIMGYIFIGTITEGFDSFIRYSDTTDKLIFGGLTVLMFTGLYYIFNMISGLKFVLNVSIG